MLRIRNVLFLVFGVTSSLVFYLGLMNFLTIENLSVNSEEQVNLHDITVLIFAAVLSGVIFVITLYFSRKITKPIEELDKLMMEFSHTRKITTVPHIDTQIKELHQLQSNFLKMTQTVEKAFSLEEELISELKKHDRQKGEFMSMISHELKTPLVIIKGYTKMLKGNMLGNLNSEQFDAMKGIYESANILEKIIGDILIAQKLDLGKLQFSKEEINVKNFVESQQNDFIPILKEKKIKFKNSCSTDITIISDKSRLSQIFSNIINNSIGFVPEKEGVIEIGASEYSDSVIFYVNDNGIGISDEEQGKIFKRFYQVDTSARRSRTGSGLGLSICKSLVEGLGGEIWVESKPGFGSSFYFKIPKMPIIQNVKEPEGEKILTNSGFSVKNLNQMR